MPDDKICGLSSLKKCVPSLCACVRKTVRVSEAEPKNLSFNAPAAVYVCRGQVESQEMATLLEESSVAV